MKALKILSFVLIPGVFGLSFGICATTSQKNSAVSKEDIGIAEQKAIEVIKASKSMNFLMEAQKTIEIRKYDLYNAKHDRGKYLHKKQHSKDTPCPKCLETKNAPRE